MNQLIYNAIQTNLSVESEDIILEAKKQLKVAKFTINSYHKDLKDINDEIASLEKRKEEISQHIVKHDKKIFNLKSLFAPYRLIPNELIAKILVNIIPTNLERTSLQTWVTTLSALTQICSHWRNIALADPHIWKNLGFTIHSGETYLAYKILKYWLEHTKTETFKLCIFFPYTTTATPNIKKLYQLLNNHPHLIDLTIIVSNAYIDEHVNALAKIAFPKLRTFKISEGNKPFHILVLPRGRNRALQAPNLTSLYINTSKTSVIHKTNLENLLEINLNFNTSRLDALKYILGNCHRLQRCNLDILLLTTSLNVNDKDITIIRSLKEVTLHYHDNIAYLLKVLKFPNIEQITLISDYIECNAAAIFNIIQDCTKIVTFSGKINEKSIEDFKAKFTQVTTRVIKPIEVSTQGTFTLSDIDDLNSDSDIDQNASQDFYQSEDFI